MNFSEALEELKNGKFVKRKDQFYRDNYLGYNSDKNILFWKNGDYVLISHESILANDWVIVE